MTVALEILTSSLIPLFFIGFFLKMLLSSLIKQSFKDNKDEKP